MRILAVLYKFGTVQEIGRHLGSYDYLMSQMIALNKSGVEITVLAPWVKWNVRGSTHIDGITIIRYWPKLASRSLRNFLTYKIINKLYIAQTGRMVRKYSKRLNVDAVYVRQARESGFAVAQVKSELGVPIVFQPITTWRWHFEDAGDSFFKRIVKDTSRQKKYASKILETFDYFITYDRAMIDEYVSLGADRNKFTIIPPAVKHEVFKPSNDKMKLRDSLHLPRDKKLIINVSRVNLKEKGQLYLLEGFREVLERSENARLIIIGPGTAEQVARLNKKIRELNLEGAVVYLGSRPYLDLPKYMSACDIGVFPSVWFEAFGRTTIDMMSCGLPMVTTTVGGMPEANIENVTGFNVEPKNSSALADALFKLVSDDDLRDRMSRNARQRVLDVYTFEENVNYFKVLLKKILNS